MLSDIFVFYSNLDRCRHYTWIKNTCQKWC